MKRTEAFEMYQPTSLSEASLLLKEKGPGGRFLAGGTDLVIAMKEKGLVPKYVVDLKRLPGSLVGGPVAETSSTAYEAIEKLRRVYCSSTGFDYSHIFVPEDV